MAISIQKVVPPSLPLAQQNYSSTAEDQYSNVLRLFFSRLSNALNALTSSGGGGGTPGGAGIYFPYGAFQSHVTQTASVINTPTLVTFDTTDMAVGMYRVGGDGVHIENAGVYNLAFSSQLTNAYTQPRDAAIWFRKNGSDLAWSNSVTTVHGTHGGQPGYLVLSANFYMQLSAGDYLELWWATNDLDVQLNALPAITTPFVTPGAASVVLTVSFVSAV